jgi:hypothetical protein
MKYRNIDMYSLLFIAKNKTLICFGAGRMLSGACEYFSNLSFIHNIGLIADNYESRFCFADEERPVHTIDECLKRADKEPIVLITMLDFRDIVKQLDNIPELDECQCYYYPLVKHTVTPYQLQFGRAQSEPMRIPKKIHYCWFSGEPMPDIFQSCIRSWKKYCSDYEIICWDGSNYDYKQNEYAYEAFKQEKWAFVSDVARLDIVYSQGGVYLDLDVELLRNIDDLLCNEAYCGFFTKHYVCIGQGFGAIAGFQPIQDLRRIYDTLSFYNEDGSLNMKPAPVYLTDTLHSWGLNLDGSLQEVRGLTVYPSDVLSPRNYDNGIVNITTNTYSIHHYSATWLSSTSRHERTGHWNNMRALVEQFNALITAQREH